MNYRVGVECLDVPRVGVLALVENYSGGMLGEGAAQRRVGVGGLRSRYSDQLTGGLRQAAQAETHTKTSGVFLESISRPFSLHSPIFSPILWARTARTAENSQHLPDATLGSHPRRARGDAPPLDFSETGVRGRGAYTSWVT